MEKFHYLGVGPLCGAQIRYLIKSSSCGWLGGLAFSGSAWRVAARDRWIGWSEEARKENLSKVICNSRFLLVPKIPNLASYILSRVVHRIKDDWNARYAIEPALIETYVNRQKFQGTCYQAANWRHIASTKGRGRMDRAHSQYGEIKDVYALALTKYFREILCTPIWAQPYPSLCKLRPKNLKRSRKIGPKRNSVERILEIIASTEACYNHTGPVCSTPG